MKTILQKTFAAALATAALTVGVSTIAMAETPSWCGPKKASIALLDGYGGNSWRQVTTASAKQTVSLCPSITKYEYADGNGDLNKSISDIKGMAAKGIDALVVFGDAGPAVLPAIKSVFKSGKVIVPYRVEVGGKEGEDYTKFVGASFVDDGVSWGNFIKSILPKGGNLLFLSGPAGNSQGLDELKGLEGRRVILVFTDGDDQGSRVGLGHVIDRARAEEVMIYAVGLESRYFDGVRNVRTRPDRGLKRLADETGGGYFELQENTELTTTFTKVAQELHSQYVLAFEPQVLDGKVHKLAVKMKKTGLIARARKSYLAGK